VIIQLLANAIAETATMSAEQVIKHSDGSEVTISCFCCFIFLHYVFVIKITGAQ